jgi:hypothetical protein
MFSSLDEQIKHDDAIMTTSRERWIRWASVAVMSLLVFGGLYAGIMLLE